MRRRWHQMVQCPRGWASLALCAGICAKQAMGMDPCPSVVQSLNVATTEEAKDLAMALNCSGGLFDVLWEGTVVVDQTMAVMESSVLTITGLGSDAIADGNGTTQLFAVIDAGLHISDLELANGNGLEGAVEVASREGGAIWVSGEGSIVSTSGTTAFTNNRAYQGGAVSIVNGATVSWSGDTSFTGNTADDHGGAVSIQHDSTLSWDGRTTFVGNEADFGGGGALYSHNSSVEWTGQTEYADNLCSFYGGSILAEFSQLSWSGVTSFKNSSITNQLESGGTVQVENSILSWQGETSFNGSSGSNGGALFVDKESEVTWEGVTTFCDNVADLYGGAISIQEDSHVSWIGETLFCNNRADNIAIGGTGGAIRVLASDISWNGTTHFVNNSAVSGGAFFGTDADITWGGTTTFRENTASTTGGAVALVSSATLDLDYAGGATLSLIGNSAEVAGGALFQSGIADGLTWTGVSFVSNSALTGGAVYSLAGGTQTSFGVEYPTWYIDCAFRDNTAWASGGGMESAVGKDNFLRTTFENNTAVGVGGALRLAGTSNLTQCAFLGNGAGEAGAAVSNVNAISVANSSFVNNTLLCNSGMFLNFTVEGYATSEEAETDFFDSVCDGCGECTGCAVDGDGTQQCISALEHTTSDGVDPAGMSIVLETLNIGAGYWRAARSSTDIFACWNVDACIGGITGAENYCASGYAGPYCAICTEDFAATLAYTCSECSSGGAVVFAVLATLIFVAVVVAIIVFLMRESDGTTEKSRFRRLAAALPVQGLKTVLVSWQILTQFDSVAAVTYPGVYGRFLDGIAALVSLDLGLVLSAGCVVTTDFHVRLLISTLGPLVVIGVLALLFYTAVRKKVNGSETSPEAVVQAIRRKFFSAVLLVTFVVYSSVSSTVFRMFACETLDRKEYLRADYTIQCTSDKHKSLQVYAAFMIMIYPIGIPVAYGVLLFKNREVLKDNRRRRSAQLADLEVTSGLWKPYKPARYYYEVIECGRRVLLTGVVVFIYPNTAAQVAVTLVLAFVFNMLSESLAPYASKQDSWLSRVGHMVVFLSMFQALLLKVDVSDERSDSQEAYGVVLLGANICMVAAIIVEAVIITRSYWNGGDAAIEESAVPGTRIAAISTKDADYWAELEREGAAF